jgi:hypothetical protein
MIELIAGERRKARARHQPFDRSRFGQRQWSGGAGRWFRQQFEHRGKYRRHELALLFPAPHEHDHSAPRPGHAARLSERLYDISGELERVEAGDDIERSVRERKLLHIANLDAGEGKPLPRDGGERR